MPEGEGRRHEVRSVGCARCDATPYHVAHGLLDQASYLTQQGEVESAALAVEEARDIGTRLRCRPLLERADAIGDAEPGVRVASGQRPLRPLRP